MRVCLGVYPGYDKRHLILVAPVTRRKVSQFIISWTTPLAEDVVLSHQDMLFPNEKARIKVSHQILNHMKVSYLLYPGLRRHDKRIPREEMTAQKMNATS
jgi:hypothetical protein